MNAKVNCTKCGKKALAEYRMALMHGPNGFRRYSVCPSCAIKLGLGEPTTGGRQRAQAAKQTRTLGEVEAG